MLSVGVSHASRSVTATSVPRWHELPGKRLHLPGEPFVEYQLAAKGERPDLFVAVAGYGDYAPWYIGTAIAYEQGGYETGAAASNVGAEAEPILSEAIRKLLRR